MSFAPGLPRDPRQVQEAKAKLNDTGTVYEPEQEAPKFPEPKKTTVQGAAPAMGTMVANIPAFAQKVYGTNAPSHEVGDPLAVHGKDAHLQQPTKVNSAPPPIGSKPTATPAPAPVPAPPAPAPAPAPAQTTATTTTTAAPPQAPPAPDPAAPTQQQHQQQPQPQPQPQQQQEPSAQPPEIPKNAKKVVTTTTTTTKIVDGKEVVETHVHHDVILKKKGFGMPKFLKNALGGGKKTTTTTTTTTTK